MNMDGAGKYSNSLTNQTGKQCPDGLIVAAAVINPVNTVIYLFGLLYCFLGIAIAADSFMCAIERITSTTKKVACNDLKENALIAESQATAIEGHDVRIWNPTIANLSLMALGSSAPEILLSVIEIVGNSFRAGDLGPGTIVGSAAFNLLCITAVCIVCVPSPRVKRIDGTGVFLVTSIFSCLAYIWLLVILIFISPNVVEVWEALATLAFFALLIVAAYSADIKLCHRAKPRHVDDWPMTDLSDRQTLTGQDDKFNAALKRVADQLATEMRQVQPITMHENESFCAVLRWLSKRYPLLTPDQLSVLLAQKVESAQRTLQDHDRLWYRIRASRCLSGSLKKIDDEFEESCSTDQVDQAVHAEALRTVEFSARVYSVTKGHSTVTLKVIRRGPLNQPLTFTYSTVNGVAKKDLHFLSKHEAMQFKVDESEKNLTVELIETDKWRSNYVFYVHLKLVSMNGDSEKISLGRTSIASICLPDDSASFVGEPMVHFVKCNYVIKESEKFVRAFVTRIGRHDRRTFSVQYETEPVTARTDQDFASVKNAELKFECDEYEKYVDVRIYDDMLEEKDETFIINLISIIGDVTIGPNKKTVVTIISDDGIVKNIINVRKLTSHYLKQMAFGAETWRRQLIEASSVNAGDLVNATLTDCLLHIIALPWKILVALVPPVTVLNGWLCFLCALALIGLITAIVGDLASIFGCMVGLKDSVTAITLVALGTSLPDTFASKFAAQNDRNADNAIGNVTGSNAVNVFLGLGLPWTIAAIYWACKSQSFVVNAGNLSFSVIIFMITSFICLMLLLARRMFACFGKGELGGGFIPKIISGLILVGLWLIYIALSTMQAYELF